MLLVFKKHTLYIILFCMISSDLFSYNKKLFFKCFARRKIFHRRHRDEYLPIDFATAIRPSVLIVKPLYCIQLLTKLFSRSLRVIAYSFGIGTKWRIVYGSGETLRNSEAENTCAWLQWNTTAWLRTKSLSWHKIGK